MSSTGNMESYHVSKQLNKIHSPNFWLKPQHGSTTALQLKNVCVPFQNIKLKYILKCYKPKGR